MGESEIIQAIGSLGFPIVACCWMFYLYGKTVKDLTSTMVKIDSTMQTILALVTKDHEDA
jgi:hypothetical protein